MKFELIIDPDREESVTAVVHKPSALTSQIEALVMQHLGTDRLIGYTDEEIKILQLTEIECVVVLDGKTWAVDLRGQKHRLKQRLYELEESLPSAFIRINKSALAREDRIDRFAVSFSGAVNVIFKSGYKEYVSRRCFADIKRRFDL